MISKSIFSSVLCLYLSTELAAAQRSIPTEDNYACAHPTGCKNIKVNPKGVNISTSPFYTHVYYDNGDSDLLDNICGTLITVDEESFTNLVFLSFTYQNNSNVIGKFVNSDVKGQDGFYRWEGKFNNNGCSSCVFHDYTLPSLTGNCSEVLMLYRCFLYGPCVERYSGQDTVVAFSRTPTIPDECYDSIQSAASSLGLNLGRYNALPKKLPFRCVTSTGKGRVINDCSVSSCNSFPL